MPHQKVGQPHELERLARKKRSSKWAAAQDVVSAHRANALWKSKSITTPARSKKSASKLSEFIGLSGEG
jgi:hypothetical protein